MGRPALAWSTFAREPRDHAGLAQTLEAGIRGRPRDIGPLGQGAHRDPPVGDQLPDKCRSTSSSAGKMSIRYPSEGLRLRRFVGICRILTTDRLGNRPRPGQTSPGRCTIGRKWPSPSSSFPPTTRLPRPRLPGPTGRDRRGGPRLSRRGSHPRRDLHPRGGRALAARLGRAGRAKHREHACAAYLDGSARLVLPTERVPQLREVDERLRTLTGFRFRPVAGPRARLRLLRRAGRADLPLHPVRPPPLGALLHTRARRRPRDHRARQHARVGFARLALREGGAGVAARARSATRSTFFSQGVLVHPRVRGGPRGGARRGPTARGCCRATARSRRSGRPSSGPGTSGDGHARLRHHPLPAGALRGPVVRGPGRASSAGSSTQFDDSWHRSTAEERHDDRTSTVRTTRNPPAARLLGLGLPRAVGRQRPDHGGLPDVGLRVLVHRLRRTRDRRPAQGQLRPRAGRDPTGRLGGARRRLPHRRARPDPRRRGARPGLAGRRRRASPSRPPSPGAPARCAARGPRPTTTASWSSPRSPPTARRSHTFVDRARYRGDRLEPGYSHRQPAARPRSARPVGLRAIDHVVGNVEQRPARRLGALLLRDAWASSR